jgi:hypothetical protein
VAKLVPVRQVLAWTGESLFDRCHGGVFTIRRTESAVSVAAAQLSA